MFDATTVSRLSDRKLQDDQEQIQVELDYLAEHEIDDPPYRAILRNALELCNAELIKRGLMFGAGA
jgi:hypothetical protein